MASFFEAYANAFQSLIGLKINWNSSLLNPFGVEQLFQSLIGLKINWNNGVVNTLLHQDSFNP